MAEDEKTRPEETAAEAEIRFTEAGSLDMENRDPKNLNSHIAVSEFRFCLFSIFTKGNLLDLLDQNMKILCLHLKAVRPILTYILAKVSYQNWSKSLKISMQVRIQGGGPGGPGPPLTLGFEAQKLSIFGPYLIFP